MNQLENAVKVLEAISERLKTQDNRITQHPMFCVQILVRDTGYDSAYSDNKCWWNAEQAEVVYEEPDDLEGWDEFGYKDRWETVMVAFTEGGCKEYLELNGHNDKRRAHNGEVRIYAESFHRCPEMIAIRESLISKEVLAAARLHGELVEALKDAIQIIEKHVPKDALGINSNCAEPVADTWPMLDEHLHYMNKALSKCAEIN